jgi:hypothetical protein
MAGGLEGRRPSKSKIFSFKLISAINVADISLKEEIFGEALPAQTPPA